MWRRPRLATVPFLSTITIEKNIRIMNRCRSQIYYGCFLIIIFFFFFIFGLFKSKAAKSRSLHTGLLKLLEKKTLHIQYGRVSKNVSILHPYKQADLLSF